MIYHTVLHVYIVLYIDLITGFKYLFSISAKGKMICHKRQTCLLLYV